MRKMNMLVAVFLMFLGFSTTCCRSTPGLDPVEQAPYKDSESSVILELWSKASLVHSGSGVILHSSKEFGTWIATNFHVASVREPFDCPVFLPYGIMRLRGYRVLVAKSLNVHFANGVVAPGFITAYKFSGTANDRTDLALLHVPYDGVLFDPVDGISRDGLEDGEKVYGWPWKPNNTPQLYQGRIKAREVLGLGEMLEYIGERKVVGGNSGGPLYEAETGLLGGLIWGRSPEGYGAFVDSRKLLELLKEANVPFRY